MVERNSADGAYPGMELVHLLRELTVQLDLLGARFAGVHRLHPTDVRALIVLLDAARADIAATPGWLGGRLGLSSASTTALIDRLEERGYLERVRDPADRRRVLLAVQESAITLGWAFFGPLIEDMVAAMRSFDESELATVRRFLVAMSAAAEARKDQGGQAGR